LEIGCHFLTHKTQDIINSRTRPRHINPTGLSEECEEAGRGISVSLSSAGERFDAYKPLLPHQVGEKSWISLLAMIDLSEST